MTTATATAPTTAEIADVLDKAIQIIDRVGWHRGYFYDEEQREEGAALDDCRVCAVGAINTAVCGSPTIRCAEGGNLNAIIDLSDAAGAAVARHLKVGADPRPVTRWNDELQRTQDDVVQALRDTAAELRAGVAS